MARISGKGSYKGRSLIVTVNMEHPVLAKETKGKYKEGDVMGYFASAQVDHSLMNPEKVAEGKGPEGGKATKSGVISIAAQTNPYLVSHEVDHPNGGTYVNHDTFYTKDQVDAMVAAAGDKSFTTDKGKTVLGIQADLTQNAKNELIINTAKEMSATKNSKFGPAILDLQNAVTEAARAYRDAKRSADKATEVEAPAVEAEAQTEVPEV